MRIGPPRYNRLIIDAEVIKASAYGPGAFVHVEAFFEEERRKFENHDPGDEDDRARPQIRSRSWTR